MYQAMLSAELGDDVLGDDPSVTKLEQTSARLLGKESGLFVPSGTMGNQIAIAVHTKPGDSIVCDDQAHILHYEGGSLAVIARVMPSTYVAQGGVHNVAYIKSVMRERTHHTPHTSLIVLENTHNRHGGAVSDVATTNSIGEIAKRWDAKFHIDGARIFNAAAALGVSVAELAKDADSITFCLSKGLGAPVGSVLCGSEEFIEEARFWRKRLGGGMRQSGLLAACGLYALEHNLKRLAEDHKRAKRLKAFLETELGLQTLDCPTNILVAKTPMPAAELVEALAPRRVFAIPFGPNLLRFVLHKDIDDTKLEYAMDQLRAAVLDS